MVLRAIYSVAAKRRSWVSSAKSTCMSTSRLRFWASSKTLSMWLLVSSQLSSLYGQPPTTSAPRASACSINCWTPDVFSQPSWGNATICRSSRSRYSSLSSSAVSTPIRPWIGSTSGCARTNTVPFFTAMSSTCRERSRTSCFSCLDFRMPVRRMASSSVPKRGGSRRCRNAFSRWRCGSTKPGSATRPSASIS